MNKLVYIIFIIFTLVSFSACGDSNNDDVLVMTSLKINPMDKDLYIGDTYQLTVAHEPSDIKLPKLTWKSSDTKVATVSSVGKVTAVSDGVATITVSYGSLSNDINVMVFKKQDYTSFVVTIETSNIIKNCVAGYYTQDGLCKKLGDLGELTNGIYSPEIRVNIDTLTRIYIFSNTIQPLRAEPSYSIQKNKKNIIIVKKGTSSIPVNPNSINEWPH